LGYVNPGKLFVDRFGMPTRSQDILRYADFLREEAGLSREPPIDLSRIYARFGIPMPKRVALHKQQGVLVNPELGIILIKEDDPSTRQRFTEGHELIELLFSVLSPKTGWGIRQAGPFKPSTKERLCQEGAAELLMPRIVFRSRILQSGVSFQSGRSLASEFRVSVTAALVQMTRLSPGQHAVVLWRIKNKPKEIKSKISPDQLSFWGQEWAELPSPKLRVEWALTGPNAPFIPKYQSVAEDSPIYAAWKTGVFMIGESSLYLGRTYGVFKCESFPFEFDGERLVISLLHYPLDRDCPQGAVSADGN
jgi:Zn-dependent peptidase ImmA (M78 family)